MHDLMVLETTEKQFQAQVIEAAKLLGWRHYHTYRSKRSPSGFPDLVMVRDGMLVALELKRESGRATPEQRAWIEELDQVPGVTARIVRPSQLQWLVDEVLRRDAPVGV